MFEHTRQGAVRVLSGSDPLTQAFAESFLATLDQCVATGQPRVVVDLEASPLLDSRGLELLLDAGERCRRRGGALRIAGPSPLCHDILRITGVSEKIPVYDDVIAAVRSFAS